MKEEKYIKEKLSNYDSPLDMDIMWSNLEATLDKKDNKPARLIYKRLFGLLGLLIFAGVIMCWLYSEKGQQPTQSSISQITKPVSAEENKTTTEVVTSTDVTLEESGVLSNLKPVEKTQASEAKVEVKRQANNSINQSRWTERKSTLENIPMSTDNYPTRVQNNQVTQPTSNQNNNTKNTNPVKNIIKKETNSNNISLPILQQQNNSLIFAGSDILELSDSPSLSKVQLPFLDFTRPEPATNQITPLNRPTSKWSINAYAGQVFSYFDFKNNLSLTQSETDIELDRTLNYLIKKTTQAQRPTNNLSYGIDIQRNLNTKWFLRSGISVINQGTSYSIRDTVTLDQEPILDLKNRARLDLVGFNKIKTLQIPVLLGRRFSKNQFELSASAGIAANYLTRLQATQFEYVVNNVENISFSSILLDNAELYKSSSVVLSGLAQLDLGYSLSDKMGITIALQGGRTANVSQIVDDETIFKTNINYWGLRVGVNYIL